ncbi:DUF4329 domain-containing protein [Marivivens marinus]|uniref:DUF4329 domain-containing protein n=1 Tax=Marivivens marinus TaxID=3110173 RepID=UPI003B845CDF
MTRFLWVLLLFPANLWAQDLAEMELARETLRALQAPSFAKRREYCGFIGYDARGVLTATDPSPGTQATCYSEIPENFAPVASYHTHGAFDVGYINEVPSDTDYRSDAALYLNGYVSTPGGRLWYVDTRNREVRQICGVACLPVAPGFYKGLNGEIQEVYSVEELMRLMED